MLDKLSASPKHSSDSDMFDRSVEVPSSTMQTCQTPTH